MGTQCRRQQGYSRHWFPLSTPTSCPARTSCSSWARPGPANGGGAGKGTVLQPTFYGPMLHQHLWCADALWDLEAALPATPPAKGPLSLRAPGLHCKVVQCIAMLRVPQALACTCTRARRPAVRRQASTLVLSSASLRARVGERSCAGYKKDALCHAASEPPAEGCTGRGSSGGQGDDAGGQLALQPRAPSPRPVPVAEVSSGDGRLSCLCVPACACVCTSATRALG